MSGQRLTLRDMAERLISFHADIAFQDEQQRIGARGASVALACRRIQRGDARGAIEALTRNLDPFPSSLYRIKLCELHPTIGKDDCPTLPNVAYANGPSGEVVAIVKGEMGCRPVLGASLTAADHNAQLGVTAAQAAAMLAGSMFGWDTPAADPASYDQNGHPLVTKAGDDDA